MYNIKKQFVPYQIALKLKELGFNEECLGWYNTIPNELLEDGDHKEHLNIAFPWDIQKGFDEGYTHMLKAPLWQQVIDYFRKNDDVIVMAIPVFENKSIGGGKICAYLSMCNIIDFSIEYDDYYEALEQAILNAINMCQENLKNI